MNILLESLPESVQIHHKDYKINTDYRTSIKFELLMTNSDLTPVQKLYEALKLYYPIIPDDINMAMKKIIWFYNCDNPLTDSETTNKLKQKIKSFSYDQDQHLIYTAFSQYYHINLRKTKLHWWEFKSLFEDLPEDSKIKKIMMYRIIHIDSNMSKEQKQFYANMKSIYKLHDKQNEEQKAKNFASILAGGMYIQEPIK